MTRSEERGMHSCPLVRVDQTAHEASMVDHHRKPFSSVPSSMRYGGTASPDNMMPPFSDPSLIINDQLHASGES